jgi:hypothetical protein
MKPAILFVFKILPFIMGVGFAGPLIGQSLVALGISQIGGVSTMLIGLLIGSIWGAIATRTGRWV